MNAKLATIARDLTEALRELEAIKDAHDVHPDRFGEIASKVFDAAERLDRLGAPVRH